MDSSKLAFKLFFAPGSSIDVEAFVPIFHHWIQQKSLAGHQLIDVADYSHVYQGPGTMLISYEANLHIDEEDSRPSLMYVRKAPIQGSLQDRMRAVLGYILQAASLIEAAPEFAGKVRFKTDEIVFRINDRLHGPNTQATFDAIKGDLETVLKKASGSTVTLSFTPHAEQLFEATAKLGTAAPIADLLKRNG
jgi:hypothetical protein